MSKTNNEYEGPIDIFLYEQCELVSEFFYNTGHNPNIITTYSFICGLLSVYYYYHKNINYFLIFICLSVFFDALDGYFARKYNMKSDFGEYYDSITDGLVVILLLYVAYNKYYNNIKPWMVYSLVIMLLLMHYELSCQEKIINNQNPTTHKEIVRQNCPNMIVDNNLNTTSLWKFIRLFSPATFYVFFILLLILIVN